MSLMLVLAMILGYQMKAYAWQEVREQNEAAVKAAEQYNAEIRAQKNRLAQQAAEQIYEDGTYQGSAQGFGGTVTVSVTLVADTITDVTIADASKEDAVYLSMAEKVIDSILSAQTPDVDSVTGATFSSNGIKDAVRAALKEAEK